MTANQCTKEYQQENNIGDQINRKVNTQLLQGVKFIDNMKRMRQTQENQETREDHIIAQEYCLIILENLKKKLANIRSF